MNTREGKLLFSIKALNNGRTRVIGTSLKEWNGLEDPKRDYLKDLREEEVEEDCVGDVWYGFYDINEKVYDKKRVDMYGKVDKVIEKSLLFAQMHPHHQNIFPFQIQSGISSSDFYYWGDNWLNHHRKS